MDTMNTQYGDRIDHDRASCTYRIHRPATPEHVAVTFTVTEFEVMQVADPRMSQDEIIEMLFDERSDELLNPIRRREAIEHTRRLELDD